MPLTPAPEKPLLVRAGVHEDFQRIVFDWAKTPLTMLRQNGQEVLLRFSVPATLDFNQITRRRISAVLSITQLPDASGATLRLTLAPQMVASFHEADGGRVVVDFRKGVPPQQVFEQNGFAPPAQLIAAEAPSLAAEPAPPITYDPSAIRDTETAPPASAPEAPPVAAKSEEQLRREAEERKKALQANDTTVNTAVLTGRAEKTYTPPDLGTLPPEGVLIAALDPGLITGAAIYRRAEFVYIVFDKKFTQGLAALQPVKGLVQMEEVDAVGGSAYRFYLPQDVNLRVARDASLWQVFAAPKTRSAPISLSVNPQPDYALGARLLIPLGRPGDVVRLYDPEVGDQLLIIPLVDSGQAVRQPYTYRDLKFIPAEQGIAVRPRIDGIDIRRQTQGLEVIAAGGLNLSPERDTGLISTDADDAGGARLFDFSAWMGPKKVDFTTLRQKWERALAEVPENERDRVRLEMARFYFARGRAQEALGLLNLLAQRVPDIEKRGEFLALRGAVRILARQQEGLSDLSFPEIRDHPEVKLWRAVGHAQDTDWKNAFELFTQADSVLASYPEPYFTDFSLLAIEAGLAADNRTGAAAVLDRLVQRKPDMEKQSPAIHFLRGVFMSLSGHLDRAEVLWKKAADGSDRLTRVRAELALTDLYVVQGKIKPLKAAERLERLRYAWRGDGLELDILRRMGKFYIEAGKVEEGLAALKQVLAFLPDNQAAADLREEMAQVFRDVFLGDRSHKISALDALSLYERFYELAPPGAEGDAIIRTLAERMVAVDLLDRAAGLLADQVHRRLTGELKGRVGTQAAGIYLLDHKPEGALSILTESEEASLPDDIRKERLLLKAKALSMQDNNDGAMKLLENENEEFAIRLKADIAWRARDWVRAAKYLEALIGTPPEAGTQLKARESQLVINRAISLAMSNDNPGLDKLRAEFTASMAGTPQADLFRILTQPESGLPRDQNAMQSFMADVDLFSEYLESYRKLR